MKKQTKKPKEPTLHEVLAMLQMIHNDLEALKNQRSCVTYPVLPTFPNIYPSSSKPNTIWYKESNAV